MSRRKTKKQSIKYESSNISKEQMIEIQAEAYYRAFKRIKEENSKTDEQKLEKKSCKWYENFYYLLIVILCPWVANKKFSISNQIYDSIPVLFVSYILKLVGSIMRLIGWIIIIRRTCGLISCKFVSGIFVNFGFSIVLLLFGSLLIMAGDKFEKETDSNKIYAYSASIMALVSCIVSIIALIKM